MSPGALALARWGWRRWAAGLAVVLLAVGLACRLVRYALVFPYWADETAVIVNLIERDLAGLLHPPLEYGQIAPLGFLWAELELSRALGLHELALRLLPFACGVLAFLLFWRWVRRLLPPFAALLTVGFLACAYYPVRHGAEVKPYAGDLLAAVALLSLAWWVADKAGAWRRWASFAAVSAAAVWFSFPAAFVAGGALVFLAGEALRRRAVDLVGPLFLAATALAASFLVMLASYAGPLAAVSPGYFAPGGWGAAFPPLGEPWRLPWWLLRTHTGNLLAYPVGGNHFGSTGTFILVLTGGARLWRRARRLLLLLVAPALVTFAAAALRRYPYGDSARICLHLAPSICILAGVGARAALGRLLARRAALRGVAWAAAAFALLGLSLVIRDLVRPYRDLSDLRLRSAVRALASQAAPADQVLVANWLPRPGEQPPAHARGLVAPHEAGLRVYLRALLGRRDRWGVAPERVEAVPGRTFLVCLYELAPARAAGQPHQLATYLRALADRLGEPTVQRWELAKPWRGYPAEVIEIYTFPPAGTGERASTGPPGAQDVPRDRNPLPIGSPNGRQPPAEHS